MPETIADKPVFTLLQVTRSIQKTLSDRYTSSFWVKAEMNKLNYYQHSGHCYPELVEKSEGKIIAQIKAILWKNDFNRVNNIFKQVLKEPLKDGIKILFLAKITFDPVYGLSLLISDIDPSYTLGDLEREKLETINQLKAEGIYDQNKRLTLPLLPQRIAIISVESSKGYADFLHVIDDNAWHYKFFHHLFPSLLQGDNAVDSIIAQLRRIQKVKEHFDVVAIIRGGGGDVGLSCYNDYRLAKEIAQFPIPVLTGIGHATNETVSEMISFANGITPTKLAEFLIQKFHDFAFPVQEAEKKVVDKSQRLLSEEWTRLQSEVKLFRSVTENVLNENRIEIRSISTSLQQNARFVFRNESEYLQGIKANMVRAVGAICGSADQEIKSFATTIRKDAVARISRCSLLISQLSNRLQLQTQITFKSGLLELLNIERNISNMSPANVLKRGYSITTINGVPITSVDQVNAGDTIKTNVFVGEIISNVQSTKASDQ